MVTRNISFVHRPISRFSVLHTATAEYIIAGNGPNDEVIAYMALFLIAVAAGDIGLPPLFFVFSLTLSAMEKNTVAKYACGRLCAALLMHVASYVV